MKLLTTVIASLLTSVLARSSVHIVSNNVNELETKPEVSLNTFSMFYSHMMGANAQHPAFQLQDTNQIQDILPKAESLFEKKADANMMVIIPGAQDVFSEYDTSFYVSEDNSYKYAALVEDIVHNEDQDISLTSYRNQMVNGEEPALNKQELLENFNNYFYNYKIELFDIEKEADKNFIFEIEMIRELSQLESTNVRIIQVNTLQSLGDVHGTDSAEYKEAQLMLKDLIEKLVIPTFQQQYPRGISTLVLTPRSFVPEQQGDTCFTSAKACANGTASCSGNGQCTLIKENCFACQCKSSSFTGESCQYVNAVNDFQLLFWTSVLLIVVTTSVVVCVYSSGSDSESAIIMTQSAPKQD